jgi:hypothetical protein
VQQFYNSLTGLYVQISGRFIRQNNSRRIEYGTCNHNALLLATRKARSGAYNLCWTFPPIEALLQCGLGFPVCFSSLWHEAQIPDYYIQYVCEQLKILKDNA